MKGKQFMGSIQLTPNKTEIDYIPPEIRTTVGDIILTSALIQHQISDLFAKAIAVNPAIFTYLAHDIDINKIIIAMKRLLKSNDCPTGIDREILSVLTKCAKVFQERNNIAHGAMLYVDGTLIRFEIQGGETPYRVANGLSLAYFDKVLSDMKAALWAIRQHSIRLGRMRSQPSI